MYERPFVVRAQERLIPNYVTIAAFRTQGEADKWIEANRSTYEEGPMGFTDIHVENWNE
jgi:hypothetical protein